MTPEQLDEARAREACRIWDIETNQSGTPISLAAIAARLAREGWKPPEPVDPDLMAFRDWLSNFFDAKGCSEESLACRLGQYDNGLAVQAYLAGARMAREQERERAKVLLRGLENIMDADQDVISEMAREALAKYTEGGR